jgi:peptide/nickel transport system substrate-binding protein
MPQGTITYGIVGLPDNFDPHNQAVPNDFATRIVFDSLLRPTDDGGIEPLLAESYGLSGSATWDFTLRAGLRFASGRPITAESVMWNFDRLRSNPRLLAAARIPTYDHSTVLDSRTIRFHTKGPDAIWPRRVLQVAIADPEEIGTDQVVRLPSPLAGSGLFRLAEVRQGELVRHEFSTNSWLGMPMLAAVQMEPHAPASLLESLIDGSVDFGYLSGNDVQVACDRGLVLQRILQSNVHMIRFDSTKPPFSDRRLREAVALAVNGAEIVRERYLGEGRAADQLVGADCFGHDPELMHRRYDPARARELVEQAAPSEDLVFDILASSAVLRPWGEAVVESLQATGLSVTPNFVDLAIYLGKLAANRPRRADLIGAGNQYGPGMDAEFSLNKFSDKLPAEQVEYSNGAFQEVYDASQVEFSPDRRLKLLRGATRLLLDDFGAVPVYQPALSWLVSARVRGLRMNTIGAGWIDWRGVSVS